MVLGRPTEESESLVLEIDDRMAGKSRAGHVKSGLNM